jgi:outer membrane protein assembly factor BamB
MLHPLKTVTVLTAGKGVIVFDADNKKLWSAALTYSVPGEADQPQSAAEFGAGPCVERGNTLFIFDQAVLTAFDLATGNARWRLPSVGIVGLFFDGQDNVIVNTTSGSPDDIKYSRQIDVTKTTDLIVQKIAAQSGKILWTAKPAGHVSYVSGNIIYATQTYDSGYDPDEDDSGVMAGLQKPDYFRVVRLDPKSGRELWVHEDQRSPSSVRFHDTYIEAVFKKEVVVMKYMTF